MITGTAFYDAQTVFDLLGKNPLDALTYCMTTNPSTVFFLLIFVFGMIVLIIVINGYFFLAPFLLEDYHITNGKAISQSAQMMKGHIFDYVKLLCSYIGWILLIVLIEGGISALLSVIPYSMDGVASFIAGIIGVYLYYPKFLVSQAVLYEEVKLDYRDNLIETKEC